MSFTRLSSDNQRLRANANQSAGLGRYMLDVPGPGVKMPFQEDPQVRLQLWGANAMTDTLGVESDLLGLTRPVNFRATDGVTYQEKAASGARPISFAVAQPFVEESRATHPAWMFKDLEQSHWAYPQLNPQYAPGAYMPGTFGLGKGIAENISTRILEKDYFCAKIPVIAPPQTRDA